MNAEALQRLADALEAACAIERFTLGQSQDEFESNELLSSAVERKFEIIGEALKLAEIADPSVIESVPELRKIVGMRNRIIHAYDAVDHEVLWMTLGKWLPILKRQLAEALSQSVEGPC
jgi:uncharacterized protein with HEPN domain